MAKRKSKHGVVATWKNQRKITFAPIKFIGIYLGGSQSVFQQVKVTCHQKAEGAVQRCPYEKVL